MTFGTLSAKINSDLILQRENNYEELFDPSRLNVKAGIKDMLKENADAIFHLVKDKFTAEHIDDLSEIKNDDGKTISYNGKIISVYRDRKGKLHGVSSACTHMGGNIGFNDTEKSWDCPCHGARFDIDGKLLNGCTTKVLKKIDIE